MSANKVPEWMQVDGQVEMQSAEGDVFYCQPESVDVWLENGATRKDTEKKVPAQSQPPASNAKPEGN